MRGNNYRYYAGKKYVLVPDAPNDAFFGCKVCALREHCYPSELLCDEQGRTDCHYELDTSLPPSEELEDILFGF